MSDTPLFQNTDEQEAAYAPQQLPEGSAAEGAADIEQGERGVAGGADMPRAETGVAAGAGLSTGASTSVTTAPGAAPAAIAASEDDEQEAAHRTAAGDQA